ncbi:MAG: indolepyruvate oxidoreductase subunit beta [Treponema sp.]|jgi:indolepyruvate ferredoxin oxidoreductase alpha subunit|nr:indolepyruvate oxidoreductase subunit beta [Treponema sp.]
MGDTQDMALLGDEAVALGSLHAGVSAAYGYPGTPSTEILEYLIASYEKGGPVARWCVNEKTALEAALGVSFAGRRALVTMKHVGLNVASDPLINGSLLGIKGGLVIAVADDPGMHSSQNEQDSRFYAAFALIPCLEPRNQQEAYDMAREAFEVSERFHVPVALRLTTRLSHARAAVIPADVREQNPRAKVQEKNQWMLLPAYARRNYVSLIDKQKDILAWSTAHPANKLELEGRDTSLVVITAGLGGNYYEENLADLVASRGGKVPVRLHIGAYPIPREAVRRVCEKAEKVLVIEEGQPFIEEKLRGLLPQKSAITGKLDGTVVRTGELDPDNVRRALGLVPRPRVLTAGVAISPLPGRPPQLCQGCPHSDSYETIKQAVADLDPTPGHPTVAITADIGCYSLGAMPPYAVPESIVCMGASIGMAKGASDAGIPYAVAVIGDSTFLHSGITGLIDAVAANIPMTLIILDNSTVAMTGCQETMIPSVKLRELIRGVGVTDAHLIELEAKKQLITENAARLKAEIEYPGLSVVIFKRECLEAARKRRTILKQEDTKNPVTTKLLTPSRLGHKKDIILAGVGGQGVLSIAAIIAQAAVKAGLSVRQSEVHGMAQRGGAVLSHLRISDKPISSDLVPQGGADLIISMEVLESLRYVSWLSPEGALVTAAEPIVNIPDYPDLSLIIKAIEGFPRYRIVQAAALAKEAGLARAVNMVMVGASAPFLPIPVAILEDTITGLFASKGEAIVGANQQAFQLGRNGVDPHCGAEKGCNA